MKTKIAVIGYIQNGDKFLIDQRHDPKIPKAHMKWEFPGGTIEFGESPEETLKREILEETGLKVRVNEMLPACLSRVWEHEEHQIHAIVLCYKCKMLGGELHLNDHKINDLRWIGWDEIKKYDFLPTIDKFFKYLK